MATLSSHPDPGQSRTTAEALPRVGRHLDEHHEEMAPVPVLIADEREEPALPRSAVELLATVLAHMAAGQGVSIVPENAELTTQQAADLLNVSRPHLIGLLDTEEIDYRRIGTHHRVRADSLLGYERREAADGCRTPTTDMCWRQRSVPERTSS